MNTLQNLLDIQLQVAENTTSTPSNKLSIPVGVIPDTPLLLALEITLSVSGAEQHQLAQSFLAQVGEHDLEKVFEALFQRIAITPFLLNADPLLLCEEMHAGASQQPHTAGSGNREQEAASKFVMGVPYFMEESWDEHCISLRGCSTLDDGGMSSFSSSARCAILGRTQIVDCQQDTASEGTAGSSDTIRICRTYHLPFQVPARGASPQSTLVFVIHVLLGKAKDILPSDSVMMRVLSRQGAVDLDSESMLCSSGVLPMVVLGYGYIPVTLCNPLRCRSVSRVLGRDHISLSLSVANAFHYPIELHRAIFDMHTTKVISDEKKKETQEGLPCLNMQNQRVGQRWKDSATVQMMLRTLSATPVLTQDEKLPIVLQPEETYSFQFNIQLLPEVSYWVYEGATENLSSEKFFDPEHMRKIMGMSFCTNIFIDYVVNGQNGKNAFSTTTRHSIRWSFTKSF